MKVHFFTKAHPPHNQNSSIYILACQKISLICKMLFSAFLFEKWYHKVSISGADCLFFLIIRYSFGDN